MKPLSVVAKNFETYFIKRLIAEVGDSLSLVNPWLSQELPPDGTVLVRSSGVYGDEKDLDLLRGISNPGRIINPLFTLETFRRKSTQYEFFLKSKIGALPFVNAWEWDGSIDRFENWGTKILIKPDVGQGGRGIRVLDLPEVKPWLAEQMRRGDLAYLLQPYWERAEEYRVFFLPDSLYTLRRLRPPGQAVANFSQNGQAFVVPLPEELRQVVEHLRSVSRAFYGAADILIGPQGVGVLELNVVPGIQQLEELTGKNIVRDLLAKLP